MSLSCSAMIVMLLLDFRTRIQTSEFVVSQLVKLPKLWMTAMRNHLWWIGFAVIWKHMWFIIIPQGVQHADIAKNKLWWYPQQQ